MSNYVLWDQPREVEPPEEFRYLRNIVKLVWNRLNYNPPSVGQILLCDAIQDALLNPDMPRDTIVRCPRNFGKSVILSCMPPMVWAWDPAATFFVTSAEPSKAKLFAAMSKNILEWIPELHHLRPGKGQMEQSDAYNIAGHRGDQAPSMRALPVGSGWAANRGHFVLGDDIENERTSDGPTLKQKLRDKLDSSTHLLTAEGPRRRMLLGTAQDEETVYEWAQDERGFRTILIPATYPDADRRAYFGDRLYKPIADELDKNPDLEGEAVDPERLSLEVLAEKRQGTTEADYLRQYEGDTRLGDAEDKPLKIRDLIVTDLSPTHAHPMYIWAASSKTERTDLNDTNAGRPGDKFYDAIATEGALRPYDQIATFIDPSGDGVDETAWVTVGVLNGFLFLLDVGGDPRGHGDEVLDDICWRAVENGSRLLVSEKAYGGGMFTNLLYPAAKRTIIDWARKTGEEIRLGVEDFAPETRERKERRIITNLLSLMRSHKVVVDAEAIRRDFREPLKGPRAERGREYRLIKQLSRITMKKGSVIHDDRADALAMAAEHFADYLTVDSKVKEKKRATQERHKNELFEAFGKRPSESRTSNMVQRPLFLSPQDGRTPKKTYWTSRELAR